MHSFRRFALVSSLCIVCCSGCRRAGQQVPSLTVDAVDAGGSDDAGIEVVCNPDAGPPDGGLIWQPGVPASIIAPQSEGWVAASSDPECAAIKPGRIPSQLRWTDPSDNDNAACTFQTVVDGQGYLAAIKASIGQPTTAIFGPDGSAEAALTDGSEYQMWSTPLPSGRWLATVQANTGCPFLRQLSPGGKLIRAVSTERLGLIRNPLGGFVEARGTADNHVSPPTIGEEVRWVNDALEPLGDWHGVFTWTVNPDPNIQLALVVDQQNRALMLSWAYPKSFGPPAPPSSWRFDARWMGRDGPLSDVFEPVAPKFVVNGEVTWFAGWGTLLPLSGGGIAAFRDASGTPGGGMATPSGWYASYPSGESRIVAVSDWLRAYEGSIQKLAGGAGYAATRHDPSTCARTALLVAQSGRTCFTLPLQASDGCGFGDTIWPDGTLVLEERCQLRWWPGLARPSP